MVFELTDTMVWWWIVNGRSGPLRGVVLWSNVVINSVDFLNCPPVIHKVFWSSWTFEALSLASSIEKLSLGWPPRHMQSFVKIQWLLLVLLIPPQIRGLSWIRPPTAPYLATLVLGVKVRNMKMDFNTGGTWRRVGQWTLIMKTYDFFFIWLSC